MAGKIVVSKAIKRKPGCMYYIDGNGNVRETKMNRGGKKRKTRSRKKK